jgi:NADPH2 dehydrogenase
MITTPEQAAAIVAEGKADMVFLGRVLLREPYWALRAAALAGLPMPVPPQYERGITPRYFAA